MMDAYAIVSVPLLLTFCSVILLGNLLAGLLQREPDWNRHRRAIFDQLYGAVGVFILGYFFWRVL